MTRPDSSGPIEIANRFAEGLARRYLAAFGGKIAMDELRGFAGVGAAEALHRWDGRGHFEPFAIQRIRWAILRGARRWLLKNPAPGPHAAQHALVATEQAADEADEATTERRELIEQAALRFRMELGLAEDARHVVDPTQDLEHESDRLRVRDAVARLPPPEDEVLRRHSYEDESFHDIAEALGLAKSTVSDAFHRGVRRLRDQLDPPPPPEPPLPPPIPLRRPDPPAAP
jgi:RNA polymerase sigma factor (sigma-70 family)